MKSETTSEPSSMPIAGGSLAQIWLTQPIRTASASTMANRSTGPICTRLTCNGTSYWQFFTPCERRSRRRLSLFECRRQRRKRGLELGAEPGDHRDDRQGDPGCDQAVFDSGRGALVLEEFDDQVHAGPSRMPPIIRFGILLGN